MAQEQVRQFIDQATQSIQSGQFDGALQLIDQALGIEPGNPDALVLRGICLSQTGQPAAATDAFMRAITEDPNNAKARYNLAVHQYALGQKREALQMAREASNLDANHAAARQLVSTIETELNGPGVAPPMNHNDPLAAPPIAPIAPTQLPPVGGGGQINTQSNPYGAPTVGQEIPRAEPAMTSPPPPTNIPPSSNRYYRQPDAGPTHSIPFIENLGGAWVGIGWFLVVLDLALFISVFAMMLPLIMEATRPNANPSEIQTRMSSVPGMSLIQIGGWVSKILIVVYSIMDLIDRRGNFVWLIPNVICSCCGFGWLTLPIYMLAGRNK